MNYASFILGRHARQVLFLLLTILVGCGESDLTGAGEANSPTGNSDDLNGGPPSNNVAVQNFGELNAENDDDAVVDVGDDKGADPEDIGTTPPGSVTGSGGSAKPPLRDDLPSGSVGGCGGYRTVATTWTSSSTDKWGNCTAQNGQGNYTGGLTCFMNGDMFRGNFREDLTARYLLRLQLTDSAKFVSVQAQQLDAVREGACIPNVTPCIQPIVGFTEGAALTERTEFKVADLPRAADGNVDIMYSDAVPANNFGVGFRYARVNVRTYDAQGRILSDQCHQDHHLESPIVLSFGQSHFLETLAPEQSRAVFDLTGDGRKQRVGWIQEDDALLAIDLNKDGVINNGAELFGQSTGHRRFDNGYEALAQYDSDHDGYITPLDHSYSSLLLWFDKDQDGISLPWELKSLADANVTMLSLNYETLAIGRRFGQNMVPYRARFWGPSVCGDEGCYSFDAFFESNGSLNELVQTK